MSVNQENRGVLRGLSCRPFFTDFIVDIQPALNGLKNSKFFFYVSDDLRNSPPRNCRGINFQVQKTDGCPRKLAFWTTRKKTRNFETILQYGFSSRFPGQVGSTKIGNFCLRYRFLG